MIHRAVTAPDCIQMSQISELGFWSWKFYGDRLGPQRRILYPEPTQVLVTQTSVIYWHSLGVRSRGILSPFLSRPLPCGWENECLHRTGSLSPKTAYPFFRLSRCFFKAQMHWEQEAVWASTRPSVLSLWLCPSQSTPPGVFTAACCNMHSSLFPRYNTCAETDNKAKLAENVTEETKCGKRKWLISRNEGALLECICPH